MIAFLLNHLWQSTVCAVVAGLLAAALRQNHAPVRYGVWLAASFKFVVPVALLMRLGRSLMWPRVVMDFAETTSPSVAAAIGQVTAPLSRALSPVITRASLPSGWTFVILGAWTCGFAAVALTRLRGWRRIRAALRTSTECTVSARSQASVPVRRSAGLLEPGVVGWRRPVLLLPARIDQHLTPSQLETLVAHELCHVRRRDNLTAAMHMFVEAVFWFYPPVWWIGARLVEERERACDEHVLSVCGDPRTYADAILNVCRLYVESPLGCMSSVAGANVTTRIEDIMINRIGVPLSAARKVVLALTATLAIAVPIVAGMTTSPAQSRMEDQLASIRTKEAALRRALFEMRRAIDQYHTDRDRYLRSLDALVGGRYIAQVPTDPFTNRADSWRTRRGAAASGIDDVRSGSRATALDGTKYSDW